MLLSPIVNLWAGCISLFVPYQGRRLESWEQEIARRVGVQAPARVRLIFVGALPFPNLSWIRQLAIQRGMSRSGPIGLTLGHGIFIREGCYSVRLLSHECRHVYQYEQAGSVRKFLDRYIAEVLAYGYQDAPLEIDARTHEIANVLNGGGMDFFGASSRQKIPESQESEDA